MSGGHFNYKQYELNMLADEVERLIATNDDSRLNDWGDRIGAGYSLETIAKFSECAAALRRCEAMLQRIDWLHSGDDGEETFHERWKKEVP